MKTTNESYQNQSKINFIKILIAKYENKFTYENDLMIGSNQRLISLIIKHLQSLKAKLNELENTKFTPTLTEKQNTQNLINNLQTQINKVVRSRKRNILFFDYSSFLCRTIKKITPKKHFKNLHNRAEQNSILSVLHKSLIDEQSKLINKHALLVS